MPCGLLPGTEPVNLVSMNAPLGKLVWLVKHRRMRRVTLYFLSHEFFTQGQKHTVIRPLPSLKVPRPLNYFLMFPPERPAVSCFGTQRGYWICSAAYPAIPTSFASWEGASSADLRKVLEFGSKLKKQKGRRAILSALKMFFALLLAPIPAAAFNPSGSGADSALGIHALRSQLHPHRGTGCSANHGTAHDMQPNHLRSAAAVIDFTDLDSDASPSTLVKQARLHGKTFTPDEVEELLKQNEHVGVPAPHFLQETFTPKDSVHGIIHLPLVMKAVVDTRLFQRMRHIRQLGAGSLVYPGATHNRFLHSIGTAYLAYELVKGLKQRQPELRITYRDLLCVTLAALCHDLGHPCFSHMFERFVHSMGSDMRTEAEKKAQANGTLLSPETLERIRRYETWNHEDASVRLLDVIFDEVHDSLSTAGLRVDDEGDDFTCVRELINPPKRELEQLLSDGVLRREWSRVVKGRPVEKAWMYEVVSNWRSGIDVDKFDYFRRDALHLGIHKQFDHVRYIKAVSILPDSTGVPTISPPDKEKDSIREDMFELRKSLHRSAYQHKTVKKLERHMIDILKLMDPHMQITGSGGRKFTMSEAAVEFDPIAYQKLTDAFVESHLYNDEDPALHEAALEYNHRIMQRRMMRLIADFDVDLGISAVAGLASEDIIDGVLEAYKTTAANMSPNEPLVDVPRKELLCEICTFHYGMRAKDPISRVLFHSSKNSSLTSYLTDIDAKPMKQKVFVFWNPSRMEYGDPAHRLTLNRLMLAFEKWAAWDSSTGTSIAELLSPSRIGHWADPMLYGVES